MLPNVCYVNFRRMDLQYPNIMGLSHNNTKLNKSWQITNFYLYYLSIRRDLLSYFYKIIHTQPFRAQVKQRLPYHFFFIY
jgi:hypothetical protein